MHTYNVCTSSTAPILSSFPPSSSLLRCSLFFCRLVIAFCQARKAFTLSPSTSCNITIHCSPAHPLTQHLLQHNYSLFTLSPSTSCKITIYTVHPLTQHLLQHICTLFTRSPSTSSNITYTVHPLTQHLLQHTTLLRRLNFKTNF